MSEPNKRPGVIEWFARNHVAANVIMIVLIVGGLALSRTIKREVFPEFEMDMVSITIPYPGAGPEEVEQGVALAVEEAVRGLDGVKRVTSSSRENVAVIFVEALLGESGERLLQEVESAVARVTSFPEDIEEPRIALITNRTRVLSLMVYGDFSRKDLRKFAERTRAGLLADDQITYVELSAVRPLEIGIEVSRATLRQYGLTLDAIAAKVKQSAVELPGGGVKTPSGEVLLRTAERRDTGDEFGDVVLLSRPDGTQIRVRDIAEVRDEFAETDQEAFFNGHPAAIVDVYRVGDQTPITVSDAVKDYIAKTESSLPAGMHYTIWTDTSEWYESRMDLLVRNAVIGLILVLVVLGLFLEIKLAFWVTMGIPISFIGALLFLPATDVSINMISLFAFIVVLGMVVDDAIVVGEATYKRQTDGATRLEAAIEGAKEVAMPIAFAIATTVIMFSPMLFVPGPMGKFFRVIPIVVILVLLLSLFESVFILPAHLAHSKPTSHRGLFGFIHRQQQRFSRGVEWFIGHSYVPTLRKAIRYRLVTIAIAFAMLIGAAGLVAGGRLEFTFLPKIEQDNLTAEIQLPFGTSAEDTRAATQQVLDAAYRTLDRFGGEEQLSRGVFSQIGGQTMARIGDPGAQFSAGASHLGEVAIALVPFGERSVTSSEFVRVWREEMGELMNVESVKIVYSIGPAGVALDFELSHSDVKIIEHAASDLAARLAEFDGVRDIDDGFEAGKQQLDFTMKPEGMSRGLTALDLGRQVRSSFFGAEVLRQQRGRDEVKVYVRLPREERNSEYDIEQLLVRTPDGGEMPLGQAADVSRTHSFTSITRVDGRRVVDVTADVDDAVTNETKVSSAVMATVLPELRKKYPGLKTSLGGEQRQRAESMGGLFAGFGLALIVMIALLAIAFRSYIQWFIIMLVIPFGFVGAAIGHIIMGFDLSMMSLMGVVALSGVVVNDSLILIVAVNEYRAKGHSMREAVMLGGERRFRPILLTSLTTFFGLMPMILETSVQARFLIPMAISLGFGVIFATVLTLLLVPAVYTVVEDFKSWLARVFGFGRRDLPLKDNDPARELGG